MKTIVPFLLSIFTFRRTYGFRNNGNTCGAKELSREEIMNAEKLVQSYKNNETVGDGRRMDMSQKHYEIEVFWHVLHLADGTGNVSDSTINRTMAVLNEAFSGIVEGTENSFPTCQTNPEYNLRSFEYGETNPTPFSFSLKSIVRLEVSEAEFDEATDESEALMQGIRVNSGEDCTKAFVFISDGPRQGSANYPQWCQDFLYEDFIFVKYDILTGIISDDDYEYTGKILIHEFGHWLGLYHTFSNSEECPDEGDDECRFGDLILDTPPMNGRSDGCPIGRDSCPNSPGVDSIHSYMDYTWFCCQYLFTPNQVERMVLYTEYFRYGLGDFHPDFDDDYTLYYFPFLDEIETINLCDQWTPSPTPCNNDDCHIKDKPILQWWNSWFGN